MAVAQFLEDLLLKDSIHILDTIVIWFWVRYFRTYLNFKLFVERSRVSLKYDKFRLDFLRIIIVWNVKVWMKSMKVWITPWSKVRD